MKSVSSSSFEKIWSPDGLFRRNEPLTWSALADVRYERLSQGNGRKQEPPTNNLVFDSFSYFPYQAN
jgi:hypothetical protein